MRHVLPRLVAAILNREAIQNLGCFEAELSSHLPARCAAVVAAYALTLL